LTAIRKGDNMKLVLAAGLALISCFAGFNSANAQGAAMKTTPTTKILAIGTINPGFDQSQVFAVLPDEVRETVDLYRNLEMCIALLERHAGALARPIRIGAKFSIHANGPTSDNWITTC